MSKGTSGSGSSGVGLFGVLGIVFVVLKLVGVIDWSWWWVLLPFWGGLIIALLAIGAYFLLVMCLKGGKR